MKLRTRTSAPPPPPRIRTTVPHRDHEADRDRALANACFLLDDAQVLWHVGGHHDDVRDCVSLVFGAIGSAWLSHQRLLGLIEGGAHSRRDQQANLTAAWAFLAVHSVYPVGANDAAASDDASVAELLCVACVAVRASRGMRSWLPG